MKAVMISIQPKWIEKIASGEKTIEVRKTAPKIETPFKCYIYETKGQYITYQKGALTKYGYGSGKVIGEFTCDKVYDIKPHFDNSVLTQYSCGWKHGKEFDCLSFAEMNFYLNGKDGYGLHISDLKIYDKPKKMSEFWNFKGEPIKRAFQSWGYVEI